MKHGYFPAIPRDLIAASITERCGQELPAGDGHRGQAVVSREINTKKKPGVCTPGSQYFAVFQYDQA